MSSGIRNTKAQQRRNREAQAARIAAELAAEAAMPLDQLADLMSTRVLTVEVHGVLYYQDGAELLTMRQLAARHQGALTAIAAGA